MRVISKEEECELLGSNQIVFVVHILYFPKMRTTTSLSLHVLLFSATLTQLLAKWEPMFPPQEAEQICDYGRRVLPRNLPGQDIKSDMVTPLSLGIPASEACTSL